MATAYHMVHYRRFDGGTSVPKGETLETLCRKALGTQNKANVPLWERPEDRLWNVGSTDGRRVLLNKVADLSDAVFGEMCLAQDKDVQALLSMESSKIQLSNITTAVVYNLNERHAPNGSQFIRGLAYWLSVGNHVFFIKTNSMTGDLIQGYMDWLLKSGTTAAPNEMTFSLNAELDKSHTAGDIGDIRSLRVVGKSAPQIAVSVPDEQTSVREVRTSRRVADRIAQMQQALPIVAAIFGQTKTDSLVKSLGPEEYLAVEATVKVRGRRTQESKAKLQSIATDLAEMSDAQVQIEGKDGRISDGDAILRTRMPFNVPQEGSSLLEFDNVADQLQEVYSRLVKDGKIKA